MANDLKSVEYDPWTGITNTFEVLDGVLTDRNTADLEGLIRQNRSAIDSGLNGFNKTRNYRQIAELDMITVANLMTEHHIDVYNPEDMPRLKKWLRQADNKYFRTVHGKF